jgi:hypothetical protein
MLVAVMDPTTRPQEAPAATQEVIIIIGKCCILLSCTLNAFHKQAHTQAITQHMEEAMGMDILMDGTAFTIHPCCIGLLSL